MHCVTFGKLLFTLNARKLQLDAKINKPFSQGKNTTNNAQIGTTQWHITVLFNCGVDS